MLIYCLHANEIYIFPPDFKMKEDIIPIWLNTGFLTSILKEKNMDAEIINYKLAAAVLGGNNYSSRMWRVKITYKDGGDEVKSTSVMVKAPVPDGVIKDMTDEGNYVEKEFRFYSEIVPKMYSIKENTDITPKSYSSPIPDVIVLEDLKETGYSMCDRFEQLDFDHCRMLMNTIATYHALSVAVAKENLDLVKNVGKEHIFVIGNKHPEYDDVLRKCLIAFSKAIKNWKGLERFQYISEDKMDLVINKYSEIFTPRKRFNVLNHGDLWTNNILFKYNEDGNVIGAKLVDFQLCAYASPGVDLNYFIWSSVQQDVRDNRIEELKAIYLDTLNYNLEELGCKERLSKEQLEEELEFARFVGFLVLFFVLPFIVADPEDNIHLQVEDLVNEDGNSMMTMFESKYYRPMALKILLLLEKSVYGVFCNT